MSSNKINNSRIFLIIIHSIRRSWILKKYWMHTSAQSVQFSFTSIICAQVMGYNGHEPQKSCVWRSLHLTNNWKLLEDFLNLPLPRWVIFLYTLSPSWDSRAISDNDFLLSSLNDEFSPSGKSLSDDFVLRKQKVLSFLMIKKT